jgi:hypothetical protein
MKKLMHLGKSLTKQEQESIMGGSLILQRATCICTDQTTQYSCGSSCAVAQDGCDDACVGHGGVDVIFGNCDSCQI